MPMNDSERVSLFLDELRREMSEEILAYDKYMSLAREAKELGYPSTAGLLRNIARDELHHHKVLKQRIETIERLGRV